MTFAANEIISRRWRIVTYLGEGSFGKVYLATDSDANEVVIKVEIGSRSTLFNLETEYKKLSNIFNFAKTKLNVSPEDIPIIHPVYQGKHGGNRFLVITPRGNGLDTLQSKCNMKLKYKTVYQIAFQILFGLEMMHRAGYVHLDIKPDNVIIGLPPRDNRVFLSDFGLATRFVDLSGKFLSRGKGRSRPGAWAFASLSAMETVTCGPREDLESFGYSLIYMLKGTLPWENKYPNEIARQKRVNKRDDACVGLPVVRRYFSYVDRLQWGEFPDYKYLRTLFKDAIASLGGQFYDRISWSEPRHSRDGYVSSRR